MQVECCFIPLLLHCLQMWDAKTMMCAADLRHWSSGIICEAKNSSESGI